MSCRATLIGMQLSDARNDHCCSMYRRISTYHYKHTIGRHNVGILTFNLCSSGPIARRWPTSTATPVIVASAPPMCMLSLYPGDTADMLRWLRPKAPVASWSPRP